MHDMHSILLLISQMIVLYKIDIPKTRSQSLFETPHPCYVNGQPHMHRVSAWSQCGSSLWSLQQIFYDCATDSLPKATDSLHSGILRLSKVEKW